MTGLVEYLEKRKKKGVLAAHSLGNVEDEWIHRLFPLNRILPLSSLRLPSFPLRA